MISNNPNKVINQYLKVTSIFDKGGRYDNDSLKNILLKHVDNNEHLLLKHSVIEFSSETSSYIPPCFVAEIGSDYYLVSYEGGKFYYSNGVEFCYASEARCFYVKRSTRFLDPSTVVTTLVKRTPKVSLLLLLLVFFVVASPTYSNLFNSRLVHGESVISLLFISSIFIFVFVIEYFMKKSIMTQLNEKIEYETKASEYFFFDMVSKTTTKDAIVQWKTSTESVLQIWKNIGHIVLDLMTVALIMSVFAFLLGIYAIFPVVIYIVFMITALRMKLGAYRKILTLNQLNDQKLTYLIGMSRSKRFFNLIDFEMIRDKWRSITNEISNFNEKILDHEETSSGILKLYTSTSIVVIFISAYFAIRDGSLEQSSIIALMLLNGRCASAIAAASGRIYQVVIAHSKMLGSVTALHEDDMLLFNKGSRNLSSSSRGSNTLEIRNLGKVYEGAPVFEDINLSLKSGESMCIVGKVGSGKSTLMRAIAGVEPASSGKSLFNGVAIGEYCEEFSIRELAYYSPDDKFLTDSLYFNFEVKYGKASKDIFEHLKLFGCSYVMNQDSMYKDKADSLPISTGQMQRLMMVRSIGSSPSLIVMDEPCSNFSPDEAKGFMILLRRKFPSAILIFATHNPALMKITDFVFDMDRGVIKETHGRQSGDKNGVLKVTSKKTT